MPRRHRNFAC
jgi:hypothetical protein